MKIQVVFCGALLLFSGFCKEGMSIDEFLASDWFEGISHSLDSGYAEGSSSDSLEDWLNSEELFASLNSGVQTNQTVFEIQKTNQSGDWKKSLKKAMEEAKAADFNDIKLEYHVARQLLLALENQALLPREIAGAIKDMEFHLARILELKNKEELDPSQKDFYSSEYQSFVKRLKKLSPQSESTSTAIASFEAETGKSSVSSSGSDSDSGNLSGVSNPVASLVISSSSEIDRAKAEIILKGIGLMNSKRGFSEAIKGLRIGHTYSSDGGGTFDATVKGYLFHEYKSFRQALSRYSDSPEISRAKHPEKFEKWLREACEELKVLPTRDQRYRLLKSLMTQESNMTHWKNFVPVMGAATDIGFGQFLPATAKDVGINPYDPRENIIGIARYLNRLISKHGIKEALARYNGGNNPPKVSWNYASSIMNRMETLA